MSNDVEKSAAPVENVLNNKEVEEKEANPITTTTTAEASSENNGKTTQQVENDAVKEAAPPAPKPKEVKPTVHKVCANHRCNSLIMFY